jgi:hypothetical protein
MDLSCILIYRWMKHYHQQKFMICQKLEDSNLKELIMLLALYPIEQFLMEL